MAQEHHQVAQEHQQERHILKLQHIDLRRIEPILDTTILDTVHQPLWLLMYCSFIILLPIGMFTTTEVFGEQVAKQDCTADLDAVQVRD